MDNKHTIEDAEIILEARRRLVLRGYLVAAFYSSEELEPLLIHLREPMITDQSGEDPEDDE